MTPHFSKAELSCRCGCGMLPELDFVDKLEILRVRLGKPMPLSRAASCPAHNAAVSSTGLTGPHTTGRAADILLRGADAYYLVMLAMKSGLFTGIGVSQKGNARFVHLDDLPNSPTSPRPWIWSY